MDNNIHFKRDWAEGNSIQFFLRVKERFTLLELLVTLAIMILLASILLPSLSKARDKSLQISCVQNLKNIGIALGMYTEDWHSYFPPCGVQPGAWDNWYENTVYNDVFMPYLGKGPQYPSIAHHETMRCHMAVKYYGSDPIMTYVPNGRLGFLKLSAIKDFSGTAFVFDGLPLESAMLRRPAPSVTSEAEILDYIFYCHATKADVLFCDGHIASPKYGEMHLNWLTPGKD